MKKGAVLFFLVFISSYCFSQSVNTCSCWIPEDSGFHYVPMTQGPDVGVPPYYLNNDAVASVKLPFNFCFYGQTFDTVYISNNGIISFKNSVYSFASVGLPFGTDTLLIAPFYSDIDTRQAGSGTVLYKITPTYMIVKWDSVGYSALDDDFYNTFQLIITNGTDPILPGGNNVSFCYVDMGWTSSDASGGFGGFGGEPATIGVNKGNGINYAQFGTFNVPGSIYYGPFGTDDGVNWLDNNSFSFNTCVNGGIIPPVFLNDSNICDTLTMCAGSEISVTCSFLCPQQGQQCTLKASCPSLSGLSVTDTSTVNNITSITFKIMTSAADVGFHTVNVSATDNSSQISTFPVVVDVNTCLGLNEFIAVGNFTVYPNPADGNFTVELNETTPAGCEVKMYDVLGNNIYNKKINGYKTQMKMPLQSKGVYFLELYKEGMLTGVKKIIIQ